MSARHFPKNPRLELLLPKVNALLRRAEEGLPARPRKLPHPLILVVGCPRSGTTVAMQWLAATGLAQVPTNFMSRFYEAPAVALMMQKLLFERAYSFGEEFEPLHALSDHPASFTSQLGKTRGPLDQNGFFHFWRRFARGLGLAGMNRRQRTEFSKSSFGVEIARIMREAGTPFAMKGLLVQYDLDLVARAVPRILVLHIVREPLPNMRSLLLAREASSSVSAWWSTKPPSWQRVGHASPAVQVAAQVRLVNRAITSGLERIDNSCKLVVPYEQLCRSPETVWKKIRGKIRRLACVSVATRSYDGPANLVARRPSRALGNSYPEHLLREALAEADQLIVGC